MAADPARLDFSELEEVVDLRDRVPVWMLSGQDLQHCEDEEEDEDEDVTYSLHLDLLTPGSRVGVMVNNASELHYYLNGHDQGCAFCDIPEGNSDGCIVFYLRCNNVTLIFANTNKLFINILERLLLCISSFQECMLLLTYMVNVLRLTCVMMTTLV